MGNESMMLEARAANCFSSKFVLKVNGRPIGMFQRRLFGENLDVDLTERRHLQFRKVGWLGSQFELVDPIHKQPLGSCDRGGFFTNRCRRPSRFIDCRWARSSHITRSSWIAARTTWMNSMCWWRRPPRFTVIKTA